MAGPQRLKVKPVSLFPRLAEFTPPPPPARFDTPTPFAPSPPPPSAFTPVQPLAVPKALAPSPFTPSVPTPTPLTPAAPKALAPSPFTPNAPTPKTVKPPEVPKFRDDGTRIPTHVETKAADKAKTDKIKADRPTPFAPKTFPPIKGPDISPPPPPRLRGSEEVREPKTVKPPEVPKFRDDGTRIPTHVETEAADKAKTDKIKADKLKANSKKVKNPKNPKKFAAFSHHRRVRSSARGAIRPGLLLGEEKNRLLL